MADAKLIFELIPKIMHEVGAIEKTRRNTQQNYAFRGIDDFYAAMQPILARHGVFISPCVIAQSREVRETRNGGQLTYTVLTVRHTLYAPDGSSVEAVTLGEAMDSGDKSANKAMSAAMKYALIEVFAIPTEGDNDTENASPEPARQAQKPQKAMPPKPAPPVESKLSDAEAQQAMDDLDAAWQARGFDPETVDKLFAAILRKCKFANVKQAGRPWVDRLIGNIGNGMYDAQRRTAAKV